MTGANRSTAVMQRRKVAPDALDYFPTPPWATRALTAWLRLNGYPLANAVCWEPACGEGHMVRPLLEAFDAVRASDVAPYSMVGGLGAHDLVDFATTGFTEPRVDWVITNPPFRLAEAFIAVASKVARCGFAMLVRSAFLEGQDRALSLFAKNPPSHVLIFSERVVMLEGRLVRAGAVDPFAEKPGTKASTATSYAWLVWIDGEGRTALEWVAPCRQRLERPGDYPDHAAEALALPADGLFAA